MAQVDITRQGGGPFRSSAPARALAFLAVLAGVVWFGPAWMRTVPDSLTFPVATVVGDALNWFAREAKIGGLAVKDITRAVAAFFDYVIEGAVVVLSKGIFTGRGLNVTQAVPPLSWLAITGATGIAAYRFGGRSLAIVCTVCLAFLVVFGLWENAMVTLASVLVSVLLAMAIGLILGIWSYRSGNVENVTRGVMNVMQTVPIFSYLVPTLLLFGYGPSAALFATVLYALPPMVHNTVLALKSVPAEVTESGRMMGCHPRQLLWKVQLPAALAKLAVGMNQAIMMTLNMVIIASMIGAGGLGFDVLRALRKLDIGHAAFRLKLAEQALVDLIQIGHEGPYTPTYSVRDGIEFYRTATKERKNRRKDAPMQLILLCVPAIVPLCNAACVPHCGERNFLIRFTRIAAKCAAPQDMATASLQPYTAQTTKGGGPDVFRRPPRHGSAARKRKRRGQAYAVSPIA